MLKSTQAVIAMINLNFMNIDDSWKYNVTYYIIICVYNYYHHDTVYGVCDNNVSYIVSYSPTKAGLL
jgi:hypothetical protein